MANKSEEVFVRMSRDYTEIVAGKKSFGQIMPKWERQMRSDIARAIEEREKQNLKAFESLEETEF